MADLLAILAQSHMFIVRQVTMLEFLIEITDIRDDCDIKRNFPAYILFRFMYLRCTHLYSIVDDQSHILFPALFKSSFKVCKHKILYNKIYQLHTFENSSNLVRNYTATKCCLKEKSNALIASSNQKCISQQKMFVLLYFNI